MSSDFEIDDISEVKSQLEFKDIFEIYCNRGKTNIIFLFGHGIDYQLPLLPPYNESEYTYTMDNGVNYDLVGLSYFNIHDLNEYNIKINIYYLINKIGIFKHPEKNYIIIPEMCYSSQFFNGTSRNGKIRNVLTELELTNIEGIVATSCGIRDLSSSRSSMILNLLLKINNQPLKYIIDTIKAELYEQLELKGYHELEYKYIGHPPHLSLVGGYKQKYLKYKQKYIQLKMNLLQI